MLGLGGTKCILLHIFCLNSVLHPAGCQTGLSEAEKQLVLDEHNRVRRNRIPTASNMIMMVWSDQMAQIAQTHAEGCEFAFNRNRGSNVGENFQVTAIAADYRMLIQSWVDQSADYDVLTGSCASSCTQYTQLVWASSRYLGCGAFRCVHIPSVGDNFLIFVCDYRPSGNIANQRPYRIGPPCSSCPAETPYCSNDLCFNCSQPEAPVHGVVLSHSARNALVQCNDGYRPSTGIISYCDNSSRRWIPEPSEHNCTLISESVELFLIQRTTSSPFIDCPGDTVTYNCSVQSNREYIFLMWEITFLEQMMTIEIILDNSSNQSAVMNYGMNISAVLTRYTRDEYFESTITVTLLSPDTNGTIVNCSTPIQSAEAFWLFNSSVPLSPSGLTITGEYFATMNVTVSFEWNPAEDSDHEAIDYYRITISPTQLFPISDVVTSLAWNATLEYNTIYTVNITAINCIGESEAYLLPFNIEYGSCGIPIPPVLGSFDSYYDTRVGTRITYKCNRGYRPSASMMSICDNSLQWIPAPQDHICTLIEASINTVIPNVEFRCLGDLITFKCSIQSNSEKVQLTWNVTQPDQTFFDITYDNASTPNVTNNLGTNVTSVLVKFNGNEYIESMLTIVVMENVSGTQVECKSENLVSETAILSISIIAVPLAPTGLAITREYYANLDTTITLIWDPPQGSGAEVIVDHYRITVMPRPLSNPVSTLLSSPPWNVTFEYNLLYMVNISAINCAGESATSTLHIEYVGCGLPDAPINGKLGNISQTIEGATVTLQCNQGFTPSTQSNTTCTDQALWIPAPEEHNCSSVKERTGAVNYNIRNTILASVFSFLGILCIVFLAFFMCYSRKLFKKKRRNVAPSNSTISSNLSEDETLRDAEFRDKFVRITNLENRHDDDIIREPNVDDPMETVATKAEAQVMPEVSPKENKVSTQVAPSLDKHEHIDRFRGREKPVVQVASPLQALSTQETISQVPSPKQSLKEVVEHKDPLESPEDKKRPDAQVLPPKGSYNSYNVGVPLCEKLPHTRGEKGGMSDNALLSDQPVTKKVKTDVLTVKQKHADMRIKEVSVKIRKETIKDTDSSLHYISGESVSQLPDDSSIKEITVTTKEAVTGEEDTMLKLRDDGLQPGIDIRDTDTDSVKIFNLEQANDDEIIREENLPLADYEEDGIQDL